ncbi:MAG: SUMF1/EgtB/PvdO family nonheme iron enzyme [Bacteroidia bacterium]|nr:SUMF1/EgtB/PvdO family nonheme iron enzyme [Bacteroidia bacterium]
MPPFDLSTLPELLVKIPPGMITLRDDRKKISWEIEIEAFQMSKFPVTQDLYLAVTGENPSTFQGSQLPVETVSWLEAVRFCNRLSEMLGRNPFYNLTEGEVMRNSGPDPNGFRLPTEAEWQYACQAGEKQIRYGELNEIAWYKENSEGRTHEVGQKAPNSWGLYDMLGNVWEWCTDLYDETVYGSYRIFRGGGWADEARSVMATTRRRSHPQSFKIDDLGFRVVL